MTTNLSSLAGRSVVDVSTATTVGTVSRGIVDPARASIAALHLGKTADSTNVLPWESIKAIGPDAITVESAEALRHPVGRAEQRAVGESLDPIGARVLSNRGVELGKVVDLMVDEDSGSVARVIATAQEFAGSAIVGIGSYALIVSDDED